MMEECGPAKLSNKGRKHPPWIEDRHDCSGPEKEMWALRDTGELGRQFWNLSKRSRSDGFGRAYGRIMNLYSVMSEVVTSERLMNESGGRLSSIWNTEHVYQGHLPGHPWPA